MKDELPQRAARQGRQGFVTLVIGGLTIVVWEAAVEAILAATSAVVLTVAYDQHTKRKVYRCSSFNTKAVQKGTSRVVKKAVNNIDANRKKHILQNKHNWNKFTKNPKDPNNWSKIAAIIAKVMSDGKEEKYKKFPGVFKKSYKIGKEVVEVTYRIIDGVVKISDAWVK